MTKKTFLPLLAAVVLLAACGEEKREGQLTLSGAQPVAIKDEGGAVVNFVSGPLKVEFGADSGRKFTVQLTQGDKKAKFSGRVPNASDWNFTVPGSDIGQPVDLTSKRDVALFGAVWTNWGMNGGPCGMNGQWETEERWQKGHEDWSVAFADAGTGKTLGTFSSNRDIDVLLGTRNTWCRERPMPEPRGPRGGRWNALSQQLSDTQPANVKFD